VNVEQLKLKSRFEKLSIDELVARLDQHSNEPTVESRMLEEVLAQRIADMANEVRENSRQLSEPEVDGRTCPPAINAPSTASFESVTPRGDSNSVAPHVEMFGPELKPSPAPRWLSSDAAKPAVLDPNALPVQKIHKDGICAESFIGEIPGTSVVFVNPNRQERRAAVRTPLASEISKD
jgi:hypothetical protein